MTLSSCYPCVTLTLAQESCPALGDLSFSSSRVLCVKKPSCMWSVAHLLYTEEPVFSVAGISVHGGCTPWPDRPHLSSSQEVGLRVSKLLCKRCTARSRTHSQPELAESRPSHTRPCSALSVPLAAKARAVITPEYRAQTLVNLVFLLLSGD